MTVTHISPSAAVRARLTHPVIDADGHTVEFVPAFLDYLRQVGDPKILERCGAAWEEASWNNWYSMSWDERRDRRATRSIWWGLPTKNTLDRATATLPKLLYERMEEMGEEIIARMHQGLAAHRATGTELFRPYLLAPLLKELA